MRDIQQNGATGSLVRSRLREFSPFHEDFSCTYDYLSPVISGYFVQARWDRRGVRLSAAFFAASSISFRYDWRIQRRQIALFNRSQFCTSWAHYFL
jgi:hypothetical protein